MFIPGSHHPSLLFLYFSYHVLPYATGWYAYTVVQPWRGHNPPGSAGPSLQPWYPGETVEETLEEGVR